jgi:hypothetical protein
VGFYVCNERQQTIGGLEKTAVCCDRVKTYILRRYLLFKMVSDFFWCCVWITIKSFLNYFYIGLLTNRCSFKRSFSPSKLPTSRISLPRPAGMRNSSFISCSHSVVYMLLCFVFLSVFRIPFRIHLFSLCFYSCILFYRKDAAFVKIKKTNVSTKFKIRCSRVSCVCLFVNCFTK